MKSVLYLASGSASRQKLLHEAQIPFLTTSHTADETLYDKTLNLQEIVKYLAVLKMKHVVLPQATDGQQIFVLTADTLTLDDAGNILGKPLNREHAVSMLRNKKSKITATAVCLEKKEFYDANWHTTDSLVLYGQANCIVDIPDHYIDLYLQKVDYRSMSGAISVDGFGAQFVKDVQGCYTAILGLPMYELQQALYDKCFVCW